MAEKKRYWLKLNKDFLKSPHMQVIKNMPNGKDYIIFYLSLMLESIETIGHLRFSDLVPYNEQMLSAITDTNIDIVRSAIKLFCELGLMQIFDDGTIFMTQVAVMTGKESESAERVRLYRERQKKIPLHCNTDVTNSNDNKEKEKEKQRRETEKINNKYIVECIDYLNKKAGTKYKYTSDKNNSLINARLEDGYTVDNIKKVIDIKCAEWLNTDMAKYLRPETLFNKTKFENYVNQKEGGKFGRSKQINFELPRKDTEDCSTEEIERECRELGLI